LKNCIGIRKESKDLTERWVPFTPFQVKELIEKHNIKVVIEPSNERIFSNEEYHKAGAELSENLPDCNVVFGIKEIPVEDLLPNKSYCFFSHTTKVQEYNMPMLKQMLELKNTLIDYELAKDEKGSRILFFGRPVMQE